jgi:hypothetical protein
MVVFICNPSTQEVEGGGQLVKQKNQKYCLAIKKEWRPETCYNIDRF